MGYYTDFTLSIKDDANQALLDDNSRIGDIEVFFKENPDAYFAGLEHTQGTSYFGNFKWYDHEIDMKMLSNKFQDILFMLEGKGEEDDDLWVKYFLSGKMQTCNAKIKITFPEFDLTKMK